jgi:hypothetical protein
VIITQWTTNHRPNHPKRGSGSGTGFDNPDNRLDNLVPAHSRCNRHKLDFLAATKHVERWCERKDDSRLALLSEEQSWKQLADATLRVARAVYFGLPDGTPLWVEGDTFKGSVLGELRGVLG